MIALIMTMRARRGEGQLQGMYRGPRTPDASGVLAGLCSRGSLAGSVGGEVEQPYQYKRCYRKECPR